ncbi:hypothetical protein BS47DRAFT_1353652 [Hydnum rufescens UP504]|uniref:N-acetyltransferase domain-containing protein n=1 Tax=Hydnum rufescens UP504 TaxID=1448309 RepID=A0A9P6DLC2_9AGAM|nr:hypothetical protein BS47DRAFT_1353652 [Hydnum rufescens UP504]
MPLFFDSSRQEHYLPLPTPHSHIRLTPLRLSDVPARVSLLNDPKIYASLGGVPFPYETHHAVEFITKVKGNVDRVLEELSQGHDGSVFVSGCPVRSIREVQPDGSDVYLGDVGIHRHRFQEIGDLDERGRLVEINNAKQLGDPTIVWGIGDWLASSHHNQGIMTSAIRTIIHEWGIPYMNTQHIVATSFIDNTGSQRTLVKNGFRILDETVESKTDMTHKGRTIRTVVVMEWKAYRPSHP